MSGVNGWHRFTRDNDALSAEMHELARAHFEGEHGGHGFLEIRACPCDESVLTNCHACREVLYLVCEHDEPCVHALAFMADHPNGNEGPTT